MRTSFVVTTILVCLLVVASCSDEPSKSQVSTTKDSLSVNAVESVAITVIVCGPIWSPVGVHVISPVIPLMIAPTGEETCNEKVIVSPGSVALTV